MPLPNRRTAMQHYVMMLARWIASKAVRAEMKSMGCQAEAGEIAAAASVYFVLHRKELLSEARNHPVAQDYRQQEQMRLARKAVIAEIRDKGRKVNSIEPAEIRKLIESYVKDHPEENVIKTMECR